MTATSSTIVRTGTYTGDDNANDIRGASDNNIFDGAGGNDTIYGGAGHDILFGGDGNDTIDGGVGHDDIFGGRGNDTLIGGDGDDEFWSGTGTDKLTGNEGRDRFAIVAGPNSGNKTITDFNIDAGEVISFGGLSHTRFEALDISQVGDDTLIKYDGGSLTLIEVTASKLSAANFAGLRENDDEYPDYDVYRGTERTDKFTGGNGKDAIFGNGGDDELLGAGGDDIVDGGEGDDIVNGGEGNDKLSGGEGNDVFVFSTHDGTQNGDDTINDFKKGDKIYFTGSPIASTTVEIFETDGDTIIRYSHGKITLTDVPVRQISRTDFGSNGASVNIVRLKVIEGTALSDSFLRA